jgi:hypothetical protein
MINMPSIGYHNFPAQKRCGAQQYADAIMNNLVNGVNGGVLEQIITRNHLSISKTTITSGPTPAERMRK